MKERESVLVAIMLGDAFGRPFEFNTDEFIEKFNDVYCYHNRDQKKRLVSTIGRYTDDTQMTIGLSEFMLSQLSPTHSNIMKHFMDAAKRQVVHGYTRGMKELLNMKTTKKALEAIAANPARKSNGCVMRAIPIGFINNPNMVAHYSMMQCTTTHPEADCIFATQFLALLIHYYLHNEEYLLVPISKFIDMQMGKGSYDRMWDNYSNNQGPIQVNAMQTVSFCLQTVMNYDNMSEILYHSVHVGGDVDSTASICMGMATAMGKKNNLSANLYKHLRNDAYGKAFILNLEKLIKQLPLCQKQIQPTASSVNIT